LELFIGISCRIQGHFPTLPTDIGWQVFEYRYVLQVLKLLLFFKNDENESSANEIIFLEEKIRMIRSIAL
jgi:hypothetical protein